MIYSRYSRHPGSGCKSMKGARVLRISLGAGICLGNRTAILWARSELSPTSVNRAPTLVDPVPHVSKEKPPHWTSRV